MSAHSPTVEAQEAQGDEQERGELPLGTQGAMIQAMHMQWMKWRAHPKDQDPEMLLRSSPLLARAKPGQATSSMITSALAGLDGSEQVYSSQEHPDSSEPPLVGSQSQAGP